MLGHLCTTKLYPKPPNTPLLKSGGLLNYSCNGEPAMIFIVFSIILFKYSTMSYALN